ncbi:hypothetical protein ElyMa_004983600 [Elysia marginata]|uniref:Uncharacterized protein n=1 Tax=Elysia marginata TaxID=1093978 RepID=A0AAV4J678_9GAST|nr:hypothetical protein ElyMa_004983600 [Elysia marginata]
MMTQLTSSNKFPTQFSILNIFTSFPGAWTLYTVHVCWDSNGLGRRQTSHWFVKTKVIFTQTTISTLYRMFRTAASQDGPQPESYLGRYTAFCD